MQLICTEVKNSRRPSSVQSTVSRTGRSLRSPSFMPFPGEGKLKTSPWKIPLLQPSWPEKTPWLWNANDTRIIPSLPRGPLRWFCWGPIAPDRKTARHEQSHQG
ncbi:hypothetical protein V1264_011969 [Littorina saxatilis]|uniref:Uncharacterized protein n=1 Tax=Littorina saxatilis TaxID=31220 RepID=A0AAN9BV86_9CAEN